MRRLILVCLLAGPGCMTDGDRKQFDAAMRDGAGENMRMHGDMSRLDELVTLRAIALGSAPLRYQWRCDGTNLPSATSPFLTLPATEILAKRITVVVENAFDMAESPPATVTVAAPARMEIAPDLSALRVGGTPNGRYRVEFADDLASTTMVWSFFQEVELPSFGTPSRVKNLSAYDLNPVPHRYYHAVAQP